MPAAILLALAAGAAGASFDQMPVVNTPVSAESLLFPLSDSVKAATWDRLANPPRVPVTLNLACIVLMSSGAPGRCVDGALVPTGRTTVDWTAVVDAANRADSDKTAATSPAYALFLAAQTRVGLMRLKPTRGAAPTFEVHRFTVVFAPTDARPRLLSGPALGMADVTFAQPISAALLQANYPTSALRNDVAAKVTVTCLIKPDLQLLCRERGPITLWPDRSDLADDFLLATYQVASTFRLSGRDRFGEDIRGKHLQFTIHWTLPSD